MNEKLIEKKLRQAVKDLGGIALKFLCLFFTGMPDRLVLMPGGRIWFVELKSANKKQTPRQLFVMKFLQRLGFVVVVIDNEKALTEFLELIAK